MNHSVNSWGSVSTNKSQTCPFICWTTEKMSFDCVFDSKVVTHLASDARPGQCSSSGIVPNALTIRAPVRNTTVPNCAQNTGLDTHETKVQYGRLTLSTTFGLFLNGHCARFQLGKASSISIFLHFPGANRRSECACVSQGWLGTVRSYLRYPGSFVPLSL